MDEASILEKLKSQRKVFEDAQVIYQDMYDGESFTINQAIIDLTSRIAEYEDEEPLTSEQKWRKASVAAGEIMKNHHSPKNELMLAEYIQHLERENRRLFEEWCMQK